MLRHVQCEIIINVSKDLNTFTFTVMNVTVFDLLWSENEGATTFRNVDSYHSTPHNIPEDFYL
jgi:hypothetical protein